MKDIIVSGMRPTGALHIGHYIGVIKNWIELQKNYSCYFFLADWHAYNALFDQTKIIHDSRYEYIKGWLACGVDPEKAAIYQQSDIAEVLYLNQIFQCLTPPGWAERSPSWKDFKSNENADKKLDNLGFFNYPILQAADIAMMKGKYVPVGEDQVSHIEISREIVRKFNRTYKINWPEPEAKLAPVSKLAGIDGGKKMSSSIGNVISICETENSLQKKVNKIKTDELRKGVEFPGNPDNCTVFTYHQSFNSKLECEKINQACRLAELSCGECKKNLGQKLKEELLPIAERFSKIPNSTCDDILNMGGKKAIAEAKKNWAEVKEATKF